MLESRRQDYEIKKDGFRLENEIKIEKAISIHLDKIMELTSSTMTEAQTKEYTSLRKGLNVLKRLLKPRKILKKK